MEAPWNINVGPPKPKNQPLSVLFRWEMNSARISVIVYSIAVGFPLILGVLYYFWAGRLLWGTVLISSLFVKSVTCSIKDFAKYRRLSIEAEAKEGRRKESLKINVSAPTVEVEKR